MPHGAAALPSTVVFDLHTGLERPLPALAQLEMERSLGARAPCDDPAAIWTCFAPQWCTATGAPPRLSIVRARLRIICVSGESYAGSLECLHGSGLLASDCVYISSVCVASALRRRGVGRLLLQTALRLGGGHPTALHVQRPGTRAASTPMERVVALRYPGVLALYEGLGFEQRVEGGHPGYTLLVRPGLT